MPSSVNGFGTGVVKASKTRNVDGHPQYDAIEAVIAAFCPIIPYKVIHVASESGEQYQAMPLRYAPRIVLKAYFNGWGNILFFFGILIFGIAGIAFATMNRPMNASDTTVLTIAGVVCVLGAVAKALYWALDAPDNRIKDAVGPHEFGSSDPYYWPDEVVQSVAEHLLQEHHASSLMDAARKAVAAGDRGLAALCVRLALRQNGDDPEAQMLLDQLLSQTD